MWSKREPFHALLPLLRHVVFLNDGKCCLTIPIVKGRCAREALPHAFNIGVFKYGKSNPSTIKHIYNESNLNEICDAAFDSDDWRVEYGDTRWPSLHTRLLDAGHMQPN